jgi:hypothetical protein
VDLAVHIELVTLRELVDAHGARLCADADLITASLGSQPQDEQASTPRKA